MDISLIISSNSKQLDSLVYPCIQSALTGCPQGVEVIVVSPENIPRSFDHTKFVKDTSQNGSSAAHNLGVKESTGDYVALCPDDYRLTHGWWDIVSFMKQRNLRYAGFLNGGMAGIAYAHLPCVERSLLESNTMRGMITNPAFYHQFLDNDLGFRLHYLEGLSSPEFRNGNWVHDGNEADQEKWHSKQKYLRLDAVTFHSLWGKKRDLDGCGMYDPCVYTDKEVVEMSKKQLAIDPYKDLYDQIPDVPQPNWSSELLHLNLYRRVDESMRQRIGLASHAGR